MSEITLSEATKLVQEMKSLHRLLDEKAKEIEEIVSSVPAAKGALNRAEEVAKVVSQTKEEIEKLISALKNIDENGIAAKIRSAAEEGAEEVRVAALVGIDEYAKKSKELVERMFNALSGFEKEAEKFGEKTKQELEELKRKAESALQANVEYFEILKEKSVSAVEEVKQSAGLAGWGKTLVTASIAFVLGYGIAFFPLKSKIENEFARAATATTKAFQAAFSEAAIEMRDDFRERMKEAFAVSSFLLRNAEEYGMNYTKDGTPYLYFPRLEHVKCVRYEKGGSVCFLRP